MHRGTAALRQGGVGETRAFGRVAASLRQAGRKAHARAYDAMIAAIAISNDLPLCTCDPADFEHMAGLAHLLAPHLAATAL